MALKKSHETRSGVLLPDGYHRLLNWRGGPVDHPVEVTLGVYRDAAARASGKTTVDSVRVEVALDPDASGNVLTNLYAAVKALPQYEDAEDV